ncbi:hypothetical protein HGRIS_008492 [Hohenbuehelia grisea]|uniref:F-box protein n=1 Tax=Hohenbuehelia grisea TaxID=104357 RepID=A0ABR3J846_9AGAR
MLPKPGDTGQRHGLKSCVLRPDASTLDLPPSGQSMLLPTSWNPRRLPQEVVDAIIDIVGSWPATANPDRTLNSLSLASRAFAASSRRNAFGFLTIHNTNALSFFELLQSSCCTLRHCKTTIRLEKLDFYSHWGPKREEWLQAGSELPKDARTFVRGVSVDIGYYGRKGAQDLMAHLSILFPCTTTLRIYSSTYNSSTDLAQWVSPFAELESLMLDQSDEQPGDEEDEYGGNDDGEGEEEIGSVGGQEVVVESEESEQWITRSVAHASSSVLLPPPQSLKELVVSSNISISSRIFWWLAAAEPRVELAELHLTFDVDDPSSLALAAARYLNLACSALVHLWLDHITKTSIDLLVHQVAWPTLISLESLTLSYYPLIDDEALLRLVTALQCLPLRSLYLKGRPIGVSREAWYSSNFERTIETSLSRERVATFDSLFEAPHFPMMEELALLSAGGVGFTEEATKWMKMRLPICSQRGILAVN